jgi:hypothetical protein
MLGLAKLVFMTLCIAAVANHPPLHAQTTTEKEMQELANERDRTHEDLDHADKMASHLEQTVIALIAAYGIVFGLLAVTTVFGARRINQAKMDLEKEANEVRERFPVLTVMETQARKATRAIESAFGPAVAEDWLEDQYARLSPETRQTIITVEPLIALEFTGRSKPQQLRNLANFYYFKYKADKLSADLERSLYYALLAVEKGERHFRFLNNLGFIYMELAEKEPEYREYAIETFNESISQNPAQQRCYYNLSIIFFGQAAKKKTQGANKEYFELLDRIKKLLSTALDQKNWETKPSSELKSLVHYNMACCLCRIYETNPTAKDDGSAPLLDDAMKHFEIASKARLLRLDNVIKDLAGPDGDLYPLQRGTHYSEALDTARSNVERNEAFTLSQS